MPPTLVDHLASCPTSAHVAEYWAPLLRKGGFVEFDDVTPINHEVLQAGFALRAGSLVAWRNMQLVTEYGVRLVGAHTDSPGLHLKPRQGRIAAGQDMLDIEVYGGPLLSSWADRDLGVAGRVVMRDGSSRLYATRHAVARVSLLAIHLDREVNDRGLVLDRHLHLSPMWGQGEAAFDIWLANEIGVDRTDMMTWTAELVDTQPPGFIGRNQEYLASARLDNQVSCWATMNALVESTPSRPSMAVLFDHEEVGSASATGAAGPLLEHLLERLSLLAGNDRDAFLRMLRQSHCVSADNSHALHPNYLDRHHPLHAPLLNHGVAIKTNVGQRYASSVESTAPILEAFERIAQTPQWFSSKNVVPCGSTIGPVMATRLGIETVDIGIPQLSMHSIREVCGRTDPDVLRELLVAYWH